jgi:D-alanine-D-alanine ligase
MGALLEPLKNIQADVVFIAMHGKYGEDGTVQGFLELTGIPYTGSGVLASALAMDKIKSNELFVAHGLKIPAQYNKKISFPCVVKPAQGGSSVGVTIVKKKAGLKKAMEVALSFDSVVLIQQYVPGIEVTCAVLDEGGDAEPIALPPTQIIPREAEFFDYHAKYTPGATEEITPPRLPAQIIKKIQQTAVSAHQILGCFGMSRTDMIVAGDDIFVLETNTIPGMTETSLYPQAAAAIGISFPELLDKIIQSAMNRKQSLQT